MTQTARVLDYIRENGSITQLEAMRDIGCMRLAARVADLRKEGYTIYGKTETAKNRYGDAVHYKRYYMGSVGGG